MLKRSLALILAMAVMLCFSGIAMADETTSSAVEKVIYTEPNVPVTLADGTVVTPAQVGVLKRSVTVSDITYNYTIYSGVYTEYAKDEMNHTNTTYDYGDEDKTNDFNTITTTAPANFRDVTVVTSNNVPSVLRINTENSDNYLSVGPEKTNGNAVRWRVGYNDWTDVSYKVSVKVRISYASDTADTTNAGKIGLYNGNDSYLGAIAFRMYSTNMDNSRIRLYPASGNFVKDTLIDVSDKGSGKYGTEWIDLDIYASSSAYSVYVNGEYGGTVENASGKSPNCFKRGVYKIKDTTSDGDVDYDDLTVSRYKYITGVPENIDVFMGYGAELKMTPDLTFSDGSTHTANVSLSADTTKIGKTTGVEATVEGFDEKIPATVTICNYKADTSDLFFTKGQETAFAPMPGGTLTGMKLTRFSGTGGSHQAIFGWYNNAGELKAVKAVTIPAAAKDEEIELEIGMDLPKEEADISGGTLKMFILESLESLKPFDVAVESVRDDDALPTLHIVSDSTACAYDDNVFPRTGYGEVLGEYLNVNINNAAISGASTERYLSEYAMNAWTPLLSEFQDGDYLLLALGHNDQTGCGRNYETDVMDDANCYFTANMEKFITEAQAKNVNVILATPVARLHEGFGEGEAYAKFNNEYETNEVRKEKHNHMDQLQAIKTKYNLPLIDMATLTSEYLQENYTLEDIKYTDKDNKTRYKCELYMSHVFDGTTWLPNSAYSVHPLWEGSK